MRTVRELVWLTQLGLSIVCPLLLCLLAPFGFGTGLASETGLFFWALPWVWAARFPLALPLSGM